MEVKTKHSF
jgi:hypothetical protein